MNVFDKYDEMITEIIFLKNIQNEIDRKAKVLQARLVNPTLNVFQAHSAFVYSELEIERLIQKHNEWQKFYQGLKEIDRQIVDGIASRINVFHLADSLGITTATLYNKLSKIYQNFMKNKNELGDANGTICR